MALAGMAWGVDTRLVGNGMIFPGVSISRIPVGTMKPAEAKQLLESILVSPRMITLTATGEGKTLKLPASSVGYKLDLDQALQTAYQVGRTGNILTRFRQRDQARVHGMDLEVRASYNAKALRWVLRHTARERFEAPAKDASITVDDGQILKHPGHDGTSIDVNDTLRRAAALNLARPGTDSVLPLTMRRQAPAVTLADLAPIDTELATYTTRYRVSQRARSHNVVLAAKAINGTILQPGATFSYNGIVGPRLKAKGYREAYIFINGKVEEGTGGGICQVSSTTYNTALLAGMRIRQRAHHSMAVVYAPPGLDATVAYGLLDLKFQNPLQHAVYLAARASGGRMTVTIYGAASDKENVRIVRRLGPRVPHGETITVNPNMKPGHIHIMERGVDGRSVWVQRIIEKDGKTIVQRLSHDVYKPHNTLVEEGPPRTPKATLGATESSRTGG